jgi:hypothetical protein
VRAGGVELTADQPHLCRMPHFAAGNSVPLGVAQSQLRCLRG